MPVGRAKDSLACEPENYAGGSAVGTSARNGCDMARNTSGMIMVLGRQVNFLLFDGADSLVSRFAVVFLSPYSESPSRAP